MTRMEHDRIRRGDTRPTKPTIPGAAETRRRGSDNMRFPLAEDSNPALGSVPSPAARLSGLRLTRGFADPPHDGGALIGKVPSPRRESAWGLPEAFRHLNG